MSGEINVPLGEDAEQGPEKKRRLKWAEFVETTVVDFLDAHKLERIAVEDGSGNKAKLSRTKDNSIKVEHSSTTIL